jgi:hypothetical protein
MILGRGKNKKTIGIAGLIIASVGGVVAQEASEPSGVQMTLDLTQRFRAGDNLEHVASPSGSSAVSQTNLTFGVLSETRAQTLQGTFGGSFETGYLADDGGSVSQINDPFATLSYFTESINSNLLVNLSFQRSDVSDFTFTDSFTSEDFVIDGGTRDSTNAEIVYETGIGGPIGARIALNYTGRKFNDTTDPDLSDREVFTYDGKFRVALTRSAELQLLTKYREDQDDDAFDTLQTQTEFGFGLNYVLAAGTDIAATLTYNQLDTETTTSGVRSTATEEGLTFGLDVTHDMPNGNIVGSIKSDVVTSGRKNTFRLTRQFDLPRGAMSLTFGGSQTENGNLNPLYGIVYNQDFSTGSFTASLTQSTTTETDGDERLNSSLNASYSHQITEISSLSLEFGLSDSEVTEGTDDDLRRTDVGITYQRELNRDWNLNAGYRYRITERSGSADRKSNEIFAAVTRRFDLRP